MTNILKYAMLAMALGTVPARAAGDGVPSEKDGQEIYVNGRVTDARSGKPVQGVRVAAGSWSALTDEEGRYRVRVPSYMVQLTLSSEGYLQRTVPLQGDSVKDVSVYSDAFLTLKGDDAFTNTQAVSLDEVLGGRWGSDVRAATRSAVGGEGANLFIRGYNSLNVNAQPLIVVDGTIWDTSTWVESVHDGFYENPLAFVDVNDIESVQILKDATSLYGSKGANGVILISTKRGRSITTRIAADLSYGFVQSPEPIRMMGAAQYRTYLSEMLKGSGQGNKLATLFDGYLGMNPSSADYSTYHQNNDWTDNVTRNGNMQHYGINVQGGDDIAKYSISLSYDNQKGVVEETGFSRLNARINSDVFLTKTLTLGTDIYFTNLNYTLQDDGVNATTAPRYLALIKAPFLVGYSYTDDGTQLTNTLNDVDELGVSNPLALLENAENTNKQYRFGVSLAPKWDITDDWAVEGRFSYSFNNSKSHYFSPMVGVAPQVVGNQVWENTVKDQTATQNDLFGNVKLSYCKLIHNDHFVDAFVGYRIMNTSFKSVYEDGHNTGNDKVSNMNNSLSYRTVDGLNTDWSSVALYAQGKYTFQERYTLWAAVSLDASSRFGKDAPGSFRMCGGTWGTFPSIGGSWLVTGERFMRRLTFLDRLNLRASFGVTGNDNIDGMYGYSYLSGVNYLGSAVGLKLANLANSSLKWEKTRKLSYRTVDGLNTDWSSVALYAQGKYTFQERYTLWAAVSLDASSRFGKDAPGSFRMCGGTWGTFPSIGGSWLVTGERFMRRLTFLDRLNLRASFGVTGNDNIDGMYGYSYLSGVNYLGSAVGLKLANLANSSLKWEKTRKWNAGIDLAFLNDRIGVSFDYFRHKTKDLLTWKQADTETGLDTYLYNGGELTNRGFEIALSAKVLDTKPFKWNAELGIARYKNEISALPDGDYTTEILGGEVLTAVGHPAGVFYGYEAHGVYATEAEAQAARLKVQHEDASYTYFHAGDVRFADLHADGVLDERDKTIIGDPNPDFTGSFANRFTMGRFALDVLCTFKCGGDVYNYQRQTLESMTDTYNQTGAVMNRWRHEGQVTDMPKAVYGDPMGNSRFSSRWIEDGSFFKLKNVRLSYVWPINNVFIQGVTFWAGASNLLTLTKYLGPDPDVSMQTGVLYQGIDNGLLSHGRSYQIGVKLNL